MKDYIHDLTGVRPHFSSRPDQLIGQAATAALEIERRMSGRPAGKLPPAQQQPPPQQGQPSANPLLRRQSGQDDDLGVSDRDRFVLELEFVQSLASPAYLNWLAQNRYLVDPAFLRFLEYLQYWKQPAYSRFVMYPCCLEFLDLLQTPEFRAAIANPNYKELLHTQQFYSWQYHRAIRLGEAQAVRGPQAAVTAPPPQQMKPE